MTIPFEAEVRVQCALRLLIDRDAECVATGAVNVLQRVRDTNEFTEDDAIELLDLLERARDRGCLERWEIVELLRLLERTREIVTRAAA